MQQSNIRQQRRQILANDCEIKQVRENTWLVHSQSSNGAYEVTKLGDYTYTCTCKDFEYRNDKYGDCKHCYALDYYLKLQTKVLDDIEEQNNYSENLSTTNWKHCIRVYARHY